MESMLRSGLATLVAGTLAFSVTGCTVRDEPMDDGGGIDAPIVIRLNATPECAPGEIECSGTCTRVVGDSQNCGSCGVLCPSGVTCALGVCDCEAPMVSCNGVCLDLSSNEEHCGACGNACSGAEVCTDGECVVDCDAPSTLCTRRVDGEPVSVCADLQTDPMNCGTCNTQCAAAATCQAGRCACPAGQINCSGVCTDVRTDAENCGACLSSCGADGVCASGACSTCGTDLTACGTPRRCVDTDTSRLHCGTCGTICGPGETCNGGTCECMSGLTDCSGVCRNLDTDVDHCGGCGIDCGPGGVCNEGVCECAAGLTLCDGSCVNLATSMAHCGACGDSCDLVGGACNAGVCGCPAGRTDCSGTCRATATDPTNCGTCDNVCSDDLVGAVCMASACVCPSGQTDCGGTCRPTVTDPLNCGGCGIACDPGASCVASSCICPSPRTTCNGACVNFMTDVANCGSCGNACPPLEGGACNSGTCGCPGSETNCSGTCANLANDPLHCGGCGVACAPGEQCLGAGVCAGYTQSSPTTVTFIDACAVPGATTVLADTNNGRTTAMLPFLFPYWGTDLPMGTMINVTTSGWIGMTGGTTTAAPGTIPSTTAPNGIIAAHWENIRTRGPICIATVGTAPNRQWVVQYPDVQYQLVGAAHLTFEVILSETTGTIDLVYGTITGARASAQGIEEQSGVAGINACPAGAATCMPTSNQVIRFTPL